MPSSKKARFGPSAINQPVAEVADIGQQVIAGKIKPPTSAAENGAAIGTTLTPERVFQILADADVRLFCDQFGNAFAALPWHRPAEHWECVPIKSKRFRLLLNDLIYSVDRTKASAAFLKHMVHELELRCEEATPVELQNRMAKTDDGIHIDLGDDLWRSILVTRDGYRVVQDQTPRFYRAKHQRPLPKPVAGGTLDEIFTYVPAAEEGDRLLVVTWMLAAFNPASPVPILLFTGEQGSGKTTQCRRLRSLIDPSRIPVLEQPGNRDLLQIFHHHAVPCFENVSSFSLRQSDILCRAVTGTGVERRKLYSDLDEVIFEYRRPILMNGIGIPSVRPDFLDRCITITAFPVDHSAFDSMAFLIEAEGKRILYSGDLRLHGRKPGMAKQLVEAAAKEPLHVLVMEGTHVVPDSKRGITERKLEDELVEHIQTAPGIVLANFSPLNVDRLVGFYRATINEQVGRTFVVDPYAAMVMQKAGQHCKIPDPAQADNIRVYFNQAFESSWQRKQLGALRDTLRDRRIAMDEIRSSS